MRRKDCDNTKRRTAADGVRSISRPLLCTILLATAVVALVPTDAMAGSIRVWSSAVVVGDPVRLADLCELRGFDAKTELALRQAKVIQAPPAGGSRLIHLDMIRSVVKAAGANMATVTLSGATQCAVTRPTVMPSSGARRSGTRGGSGITDGDTSMAPARLADARSDSPFTLRKAVIHYFNAEFARYGGTAEVTFDRTSQQVLGLSGPDYEFRVRRRGGSPLGLTSLEVDVLAGGRTVQTVPLVVQVTMLGEALAARRSINQDATIRAADVHLVQITFTRLDKLGLDDSVLAVGQRAKRFVPAGALIEPSMLEAVPLVRRGQLVQLASISGGVRVVTTAKAAEDGLLGDVITVRAVDNKRIEYDAMVVGPCAVQIGSGPAGRLRSSLAMGGGR